MKQLASYVGSKDNRYGLTNDVGKSYQMSKTSQWGVAVAKNSSRDLIAPVSPAAMISSSFAPSGLLSSTFSHGHGMEFQKRSTRRPSLGHLDDGDENTKLTKFASPVSTPGGGSSPVYGMKIPRSNEGMFDNDSTISPPFFPRGKIPTTRSSVRLDIQDTSDENDVEDGSQIDSSQQMSSLSSMKETNILIPPTAGKYVPPHLRPKKYIPPHLRQKEAGKGIPSANIANEKKPAPSKSSLSNLLATQDTVNDIQDQVRSESKEFETEYLHSNGFGQDIGDGIDIEDEKNSTSSSDSSQDGDEVIFKLGGCADPLLVVGSICDPMYKPISASKVGNTHAPAYHGFLSEHSEIGAVSACGIRDKNEDAYVILSDLLHTDHLEDADTIDISDSYFSRFANHALFAIFDGHCGNHAARYASEKFHSILLDESCSFNEEEGAEKKEEAVKKVDILKEILNNSIERLDAEFCDFCTDDGRGWYSGSTAIIGLMVDDDIAVASVGDASGVLSASAKNIDSAILTGWSVLEEHEEDLNKIGGSKGGIIFKEVAESHCPSRPAERERIQAANGWVTHETDIPIISQFQRMNWSDEDVLDIFHRCFSDRFSDSHGKPSRILDIYRVCGDLAVSRAIGDREYKAAFNKSETQTNEVNEWKSPAPIPFETYNDIHGEEHPGIFEGDLVIATPSIQFFQVGSYEDEFIVIACDGLWDVIDPDDAVRVTRNLIFVLGFSAKECAERLAELAGGLGSSDNITVIVVRFFGKSTDSTFETTNS
jgi:serine/threonine protein phosphatase PrpC